MIKTKKSLIILMVAMISFTMFKPTVNDVVASGNNFSITGDITTPTNKDINMDVIISDTGDSGIKQAIMPDKTILKESGKYNIKENGTYTFSVEDNAGNLTSGELIIKNIFKIKPTLDLTAPKNLTNKDVTINIKAAAIGEGNSIKEIKGPGAIKITGDNYVVTKNGTYEFTAIDIAGNEITKSIVIENINKVLPVITIGNYNKEWTNKDITVTATTTKGTLNAKTHVFKENGSFTFTATDEYGNKADVVIKITNIDKEAPKMEIKVVK